MAQLVRARALGRPEVMELPPVALGDGAQIVARRFHDRAALRAASRCLGS